MNRKVFAFDIDGTIINNKEVVHPNNIEAFIKAKEQGHVLVLCSGRPTFDMVPIHKQMPEGLFEYEICNNGAYVVDTKKKDEKIICGEISNEEALKLFELGEKYGILAALHTDVKVVRAFLGKEKDELFDKIVNAEWHKFTLSSKEVLLEAAKNHHITQASLRANAKIINQVYEEALKSNPKDGDYHIAGEVYLDLNPVGISKLSGIERLSEMLNIPVKDFVVFGDSGNDLQMLEGAGWGVAMGNATQQAKDVADEVIGDNNTDAIGKKMLEILKGE